MTKKAASNWVAHGVTFEMAREAFNDRFAVEWFDDRHLADEERYRMLAVAGGHLFHVAYALRGQRTRIISARSAEPHERRRYHEENREA